MDFLRKMVNGSPNDGYATPYTIYPLVLFTKATKRFKDENIGNKVLVGITGEIMGLALAVFMFLETVVVALLVGLILLGLSVQAKIENKMASFAIDSKDIAIELCTRAIVAFYLSFLSGVFAANFEDD